VTDIIGDGKEAWYLALSIANMAAPTVAEISAGTRISQWMTKDGATGFSPETADAPTSGIETTFDTAVNGRRTYSNTRLRFKKQTGTDYVYTTMTPDAIVYLVRRRSLAAATVAPATGQACQVFQVMCGETAWVDVEDNMPERFDIPVKMMVEPKLRASIA
jgi:hypothetical protein